MSEQQHLRHPSKGTAPRGVTRLCQLRSACELLPGTLAHRLLNAPQTQPSHQLGLLTSTRSFPPTVTDLPGRLSEAHAAERLFSERYPSPLPYEDYITPPLHSSSHTQQLTRPATTSPKRMSYKYLLYQFSSA